MSNIAGFHLGGPDRVSIAFLESLPHGLYISPLVDNYEKDLHYFIKVNYFQNGAALFGRESHEEMDAFRRIARGRLDSIDNAEIYTILQYFVQRTRNYAHIETLASAKIRRARVSNDIPRHRWCRQKMLKPIDIIDAASKVAWIKTIRHDQYGKQVFGLNWGIPPFYLECKCILEGIIPGLE